MGICRYKALISAPLPQVWDFIIRPEDWHQWCPFLPRPATGLDRPLQTGDQITQWRKDFFMHRSRVLVVEEVIPYRAFHLRVLTPAGARITGGATLRVEEAEGGKATWIEEVISYSFRGPVARWLDRWLINPLLGMMVRHKSKKAFQGLEAHFAPPPQQPVGLT